MFHMIGGVIHAAFWIFLIAGTVWFLRRMPRRSARRYDPVRRSLAVLNERYARGDIDRDEYLERKAYLE
jgi:uncharacterized membrane protein